VIEISGQQQQTHRWTPETFGLSPATAAQLQAKDPADSAAIIRRILDGERGAPRDVVVAGTAAALWLVGKADSLAEGAKQAEYAIDSGAAKAKLHALVASGQKTEN
jgi:anthranilate phosphoribosyltransferase